MATGGTIKAGEAAKIGDKIKTATAPAATTATGGATKVVKISAEAVKVGETTAAPVGGGVLAVRTNSAARTMVVAATSVAALAVTIAGAPKAASAAMTTPVATMALIKAPGRLTVAGPVTTVSRAAATVGSGIVRATRSPPGSAMMRPSVAVAWTNSAQGSTGDVVRRATPARMTASVRMSTTA